MGAFFLNLFNKLGKRDKWEAYRAFIAFLQRV